MPRTNVRNLVQGACSQLNFFLLLLNYLLFLWLVLFFILFWLVTLWLLILTLLFLLPLNFLLFFLPLLIRINWFILFFLLFFLNNFHDFVKWSCTLRVVFFNECTELLYRWIVWIGLNDFYYDEHYFFCLMSKPLRISYL